MHNIDIFRRRTTLSVDMDRINIGNMSAGEYICDIIEKQCIPIATAIESRKHNHIVVAINNSYLVAGFVKGAIKKCLAYTDVHIKTKKYENGITGPRLLKEIIFSNDVKVDLLSKYEKNYEEKYNKYVNDGVKVMLIDDWRKGNENKVVGSIDFDPDKGSVFICEDCGHIQEPETGGSPHWEWYDSECSECGGKVIEKQKESDQNG